MTFLIAHSFWFDMCRKHQSYVYPSHYSYYVSLYHPTKLCLVTIIIIVKWDKYSVKCVMVTGTILCDDGLTSIPTNVSLIYCLITPGIILCNHVIHIHLGFWPNYPPTTEMQSLICHECCHCDKAAVSDKCSTNVLINQDL